MDSRRGTRRRLIRPRAIKRRVRRRSGQLGVKTRARFEILLAPTRFRVGLTSSIRCARDKWTMSSTKRRWTICAGAPWLGHVVDQLAERGLGRMCDHATRARGTTAQTRADLARAITIISRITTPIPPRRAVANCTPALTTFSIGAPVSFPLHRHSCGCTLRARWAIDEPTARQVPSRCLAFWCIGGAVISPQVLRGPRR